MVTGDRNMGKVELEMILRGVGEALEVRRVVGS